MFRKYLVSIHRFYFRYHKGETYEPMMPPMVFSLTFFCIFYSFDMVFNSGNSISWLREGHPWFIHIPFFLTGTIVFIWYKSKLPTQNELRKTGNTWFGIILSIIFILIALLISIFYSSP